MGINYLNTDSITPGGNNWSDVKFLDRSTVSTATNLDFGYYKNPSNKKAYTANAGFLKAISATPAPQNYYTLPSSGGSNSSSLIGEIRAHLANVQTLSVYKNDSNLSDDTKAQVQKILNKATKIEKFLNKCKNNGTALNNLSAISADLDVQAKELYNICTEELANYASSNSDEVDNRNNDNDSATEQDESSVKVAEGDVKLSNEEIQKRYGINPVCPITEDITASSLASGACNGVNDWDDDDSRAAFVKYFGDDNIPGQVTANNIIQVLSEINKINMKEFIEDIQDQDEGDGEASIRQLVKLVNEHLEILLNNGILSKKDKVYKSVVENLKKIGDGLSDFDGKQDKIAQYFTNIQSLLINIGTQEYVNDKIAKAQKTEEAKATKAFVKDFINTNKKSDKSLEYDENSTYSLPAEIIYLPNKQVFKATIEGKTFQGKDFKELDNKIRKCKDESVILTWSDIKKDWMAANCKAVSA